MRIWRFEFASNVIRFLGAKHTYEVTFTSEDRENW